MGILNDIFICIIIKSGRDFNFYTAYCQDVSGHRADRRGPRPDLPAGAPLLHRPHHRRPRHAQAGGQILAGGRGVKSLI